MKRMRIGDMDFTELIESHHSDYKGFARHYMLLYSVVLGLEAESCFEFGVGFSSQVIIDAMEPTGGTLISCDTRGLENFNNVPLKNPRWSFYCGNSLDIVPTLPKPIAFDFVLHDGSHTGSVVEQDLRNIVSHVKQNGIIMVHDSLHSKFGKGVRKAIDSVMRSYKHEKLLLPYGCGLTIIKVRHDFGRGKVSPVWRKMK